VPEIILGLVLIVGLVMIVRGFLNTEPRVLAQILRWTAAALATGVAILLIISGREGLLFSMAALASPLVMRWGGWRRRFGLGGAPQPAPGRSSQVETRLLRMTLDHDSGTLSGLVLAGDFAGQTLDRLGFDQLMTLLGESHRQDPASVPVLEAWLDRYQGADWRQRAAAGRGSPHGGSGGDSMTREEAFSILGLKPGAGPAAIKEAHRTLMAKVHPDHGGSTWLAVKLNQARDLLLNS
jgi:hypothetical protein